MKKVLAIILGVLVVDQGSKFWIKTNMYLGQEFSVLGNWFIIHFTENNGMAFGLEFGGDTGKIALSIFRIIAVIIIGYYLFKYAAKPGVSNGLIVAGSLIFAGALGNIIDSAFYGLLFTDSYHQIARLTPEEGGYAPFLFGRVVDMLYFPLADGYYPAWLPDMPEECPAWCPMFVYDHFPWANQRWLFFRPVFNIADTAITAGIVLIIIFQKRFFSEPVAHDSFNPAVQSSQAPLS